MTPRVEKRGSHRLLVMGHGGCKWLLRSERWKLMFRLTNVHKLERKYWNDPDFAIGPYIK